MISHSYPVLSIRLFEIPSNLMPDPFSNRNRNTIPDHSIGVIRSPRESEGIGHSLQPCVFPNRVGSNASWEPLVSHQSRAQVFGVVRNAGGRDVPALWITDDWTVSILSSEASVYIIRNVRSWLGLKYFR